MGRTEREFMSALLAGGYDMQRNRTVPWLTTRGHLDGALVDVVPSEVLAVLRRIFLRLGGKEDLLSTKRILRLRPDAFLDERILELDEIQHFSSARLATLALYPDNAALGFDRHQYERLCSRWAPRGGDGYRAAKQTREFPQRGGRTAQRAYFDALRDLIAPYAGAGPVIRIHALECDAQLAFARLREQVSS